MKKIFTIAFAFAMFLYSNVAFAQSQRLVFVEEFTQASCGPCAGQNPDFDALLNSNADKVVVLKYQVSWPGFDPMYEDNPAEVDDRVAYYGVGGVPNGFVNGIVIADDCSYYEGAPACLDQAEIDASYATAAPFDITITASADASSMDVEITVTCTQDVSGTLKLRAALAETQIAWDTAPGSNGETEFNHIMKKMFTTTAGETMATDWTAGMSETFNYTVDLNALNIYDFGQLEVVAFIQDDATQDVHQAALNQNVEFTVAETNNSTAVSIAGLPSGNICAGEQTITPSVTIKNSGNDELTTLDIVYSMNGEAAQTYNWTGSLATFAAETVTLDPITFSAAATNTFSATLENPNGATDEVLDDNNISGEFTAISLVNEISVILNTDCWPEENSWEIRSSAGAVLASGGSYDGQTETEIIETVVLPAGTDCFEFVFMDTYGDGLNGSIWSECTTDGNLTVQDGAGNVGFYYDGSYGAPEISGEFEATIMVNTQENELNNQFTVAPNPVRNNATMFFTLNDKQETFVRVLNVTGEVVYTKDLGMLSAGQYTEKLSLEQLSAGIYFINLVSGEATGIKKVSVIR